MVEALGDELSSTFSTRVGTCCRAGVPRFRKRVDYSEYGGAPLLGVNGSCIVGTAGRRPRRCATRSPWRTAFRAIGCVARLEQGIAAESGERHVIAFVFPGQGSQKVGMGRALAEAFPECRAVFEEADAALGEPLSQLCFEGPEDRLALTENTQPAILTVSVAAARLLAARGIRPAIVAGHSLGEYSAHVAAGTFAFADAVRIVRRRGRYMQEAVPVGTGAMAAVLGLDERAGRARLRAKPPTARWSARPISMRPARWSSPGTRPRSQRAGERAKARGAKRVIRCR